MNLALSAFPRTTRWVVRVSAALCLAVALVSFRYLMPFAPAPDGVDANRFLHPWLAWHAISAATALLLGPWQFRATLRARRPRLHRAMGRLYVAACLVGGVTGGVLALGVSTGLVPLLGFGILAVWWVYTTTQALRMALQRQFPAHRKWMIRSFALTFAAVTLRLQLVAADLLPVDDDTAYRVISFLCWVPNAVFAELWLRRRPATAQPLRRHVVPDGRGYSRRAVERPGAKEPAGP